MFDSPKFNADTSICYGFLHVSWQISIVIFLVETFFFVPHVSVAATDQHLPHQQTTTYQRDEHQQQLPSKYKYGYHVRNSGPNGGQHGHHFLRNGQRVEGKYYVKLNDGAAQNVEYYSDNFGYHPKVVYNNHVESGSSGAKMLFGGEAINFGRTEMNRNVTKSNVIGVVDSASDKSSSTEANVVYGTRIEHPITFSTLDKNGSVSAFAADPAANDFILSDGVPTYESPLMFTHQPVDDETFIRPEINEISNGFIGKIVSVLPGMFTPSKLLRPIIVSENATRKMDSSSNSTDQMTDGAHVLEYRDASFEDGDNDATKNETEQVVTSSYDESKIDTSEGGEVKKPSSAESSVEVLIEPQVIEEQAVITTTLDIAKSLPLNVNFVPEVDNSIQESTVGIPVPNILPATFPPVHLLNQPVPNTFDSRPLLNMPYPGFHYIPVPILQHQPNVIPLNLLNVPSSPSFEESNLTRTLLDLSARPKDTAGHGVPQHFDSDRKQVKHRSIGNAVAPPPPPPPNFQSPLFVRKPTAFTSSYATSVSANHLMPYIKHMTSSPSFLQSHPYTQYLSRQRSGFADLPPVHPQSMSYNIRYFPKENGKAATSHHQKSMAPFKPSHPLWDSIYPPSHMYYVPYYVFDKIPPGERKARDSFPKNRRYLRRLYVEYGGFKPPLIPSTLLEADDADNKEKSEVPKEKVDSA